MKRIILYIATSFDGFIARKDGSLDWLPGSGEGNTNYENIGNSVTEEDYGYDEFFDSVDVLLIGRKTYEQILSFKKWPYEAKKCYVFSRNDMKDDDRVVFSNNIVNKVRELMSEDGKDIWLVGGAGIINSLLEEKLIDEIIITIIPIVLGDGIKLFDVNSDIKLELIDCKKYDSGFVQIKYKL